MRKPAFSHAILARVFIACVGLLGYAACAKAQNGDLVSLENGAFSMTIKKSPAPYILRIVHKKSGRQLLSDTARPVLFTILLAKQGGEDHVESSLAKKTSLKVARVAGGSEVVITYAGFPGLNLSARVKGTFSDDDPLSLWTIEVENHSGRKINSVQFPYLRALPTIGDGDDDFVVLPDMEGSLIRKPWTNFSKDWDGVWLNSPGELSSQFLTYQDASAGLYLASQDSAGYVKRLMVWREGKELCLGHDFYLSADVGEHWESPYPVAIGVTQGSWQDSADIYKAWAVEQSWCAKTLAQRDDLPGWWKKGPMVYITSARSYDEKGINDGSYYPRLLESLHSLQGQTGGQFATMISGWEKHRAWAGGDYFPVYDDANAGKVIPRIASEGFHPFFYLSGLFYAFEFKGDMPQNIPVPREYLSQFVVDRASGTQKVFSLEDTIKETHSTRSSYAFCVGSPLVKSFYRNVIDESAKLGVNVLQMDQVNYGAGEPCWSKEHGHVPGIGAYQTQGLHALLADMRDYGKSKNADFVLTIEEPHEELIPYLDGFHMRESTENEWPRSHPGTVGIPLFSYLYHEYAIGYGGDAFNMGPKGNPEAPWFTRGDAVNLVSGKTPAGATWTDLDIVYNADPRVIKMLRNHCSLLGTEAVHCLMEGKMLHPLTIDVPLIPYSFTYWYQGKPSSHLFPESAILTSSWQAPDGSVGHVFVNASERKQSLDVDLDTRNAPSWDLCDASICRSEDGNQFKSLWKSASLPRKLSTELAPGEVLFVELRDAGSSAESMTPSKVRSFEYVIAANLRTPGIYEAIANSPNDLIILGGGDFDAKLDRNRADPTGRKLIVSAVDPAEGAAYWYPQLFVGGMPPSWFGKEHPAYPGLYTVPYWDPAWEPLLFHTIDQIAAAGLDGIFLDVLDGNLQWGKGNPYGNPVYAEAIPAMAKLLGDIRAYVDGKHLDRPFYLIGNNPSIIGKVFPSSVRNLDMIFNEIAFWVQLPTDGTRSHDIGDGQAQYIESTIAPLYKASGLPVLGNDYPLPFSDPKLVLPSFELYSSLGWIPSVTQALQDTSILKAGPFLFMAVPANPTVTGSSGFVNFLSGGQVDKATLTGGDRGDYFLGGPGRNRISGGSGDDTIYAHPAKAVEKNLLRIRLIADVQNVKRPTISVLVNGRVAVKPTTVTADFQNGQVQELAIDTTPFGRVDSIKIQGEIAPFTDKTHYANIQIMGMSYHGQDISFSKAKYNSTSCALDGGAKAMVNAGGTIVLASPIFPIAGPAPRDTADAIDGGGGVNTVVYRAASSNYVLKRQADGSALVTSAGTDEGPDTLRNIQFLRFADKIIPLTDITK